MIHRTKKPKCKDHGVEKKTPGAPANEDKDRWKGGGIVSTTMEQASRIVSSPAEPSGWIVW
jgi:hypothetical protein